MFFFMLERLVTRLIRFKLYIIEVCDRIDNDGKIAVNDYRRFLRCAFYLFLKNPLILLINIIKIGYILMFYMIHYLILKIFIIPTCLILYFLFKPFHNLLYLFIEFIYMFLYIYIIFFKGYLYKFRKLLYFYNDDLLEAIEENKKLYMKTSFETHLPLAPDLRIYYPMRFALSSVLIRLTGVILAVVLLLLIYLNFFNIYLMSGINYGDIETVFNIKMIKAFEGYILSLPDEDPKYLDKKYYNTETLFGVTKCLFIIIKTQFFVWYKFYYYYLIGYYELFYIFYLKYILNLYFYLILPFIFIFILPIHFYYAYKHFHKTLAVEQSLITFIYITFLILKFLIINISLILYKIYNLFISIFPEGTFYSAGGSGVNKKIELLSTKKKINI